MLIIKIKYKTLIWVLIFIVLFFVLRIVVVEHSVVAHSEFLQKEFEQRHLKGKTIQEFVRIFGKPNSIEYITPMQYDMETFEPEVSESGAYFKLTYYTGNPILDSVGWFPCGGTKVFADKNNKLTGVKEYCY
jgi:hypothetical protein